MDEPILPGASSQWPRYSLFGVTLASDFALASRLAPAAGPADLVFTCVDRPPVMADWAPAAPAYASPFYTEDGQNVATLHRLADCDVLRFAQVGDFYLWPDRILCHRLPQADDSLVEICLLGTVLAFWLERQGVLALHASAVVVDGRAIAFLSSNQGGKSSLAAALMQAGCPLLTDDILPVEQQQGRFWGRPGYPTMRLWPEEAQHFLGDYRGLGAVHPDLAKRRAPVGPGGFGRFCPTPQPLAAIYAPARRQGTPGEAAVEITALSAAAAAIELVRHSFAARIVEALGWQPRRLRACADLVQAASVRRLAYASGLDNLPAVAEAILADVEGLAQAPRAGLVGRGVDEDPALA